MKDSASASQIFQPKLLLYTAILALVFGSACTIALDLDIPGISSLSSVFRLLELRSYGAREAFLHGPALSGHNVVVVEIDDRTSAALGRIPLRRAHLASVIERIATSGAAVVAVDIQIYHRTSTDDDEKLKRVVRAHRERIVLAKTFNAERVWQPLLDDLEETLVDPVLGPGTGPPLAIAEVDGTKRRIPLVWYDPPCTPFCVVVASRFLKLPPRSDVRGTIAIGSRYVQYGYDGTVVVRPPDYGARGDAVSFLDVWRGNVPAERLAGRIVLLAPPHDRMIDPDVAPGFVQAAAIEQVLSGRPAVRVPPQVGLMATAVIVVALLFVFYRQTWWKSLPAALLFLAVYAGLTVYLLAAEGIWMDLVLPLTAGLSCIALVGLGEGFRLKLLFARLLPRELGQSLLESADANTLGDVLDTARAMSGSLKMDNLLDRLEDYLATAVPHTTRGIHVIDPKSGTSSIVRRWTAEGATPLIEEVETSIVGAARETQRPLRIDDLRRVPSSLFPVAVVGPQSTDGVRSLLAIPMTVEGLAVGVAWVGAPIRGAFSNRQQDLVSALALQVASLLRNAQLHHEVLEAHSALAESKAQLVQSSKMAAIGQLAAGVAHEINNPLGAVFVNIDAALPLIETKPEKARRKLELSREALCRVRAIVEQLLDFSRENAKKTEVALHAVAHDALDLLAQALETDGVRPIIDLQPLPTVRASHAQLQQVVMNLLLNARDAVASLDPARSEVRVNTRVELGDAILEVIDNGPGIAPEVVERIFEPFFTTKPVGKGTGLGLWVSQRIVAEHGGSLDVDTRPGGPTAFRLHLPLS